MFQGKGSRYLVRAQNLQTCRRLNSKLPHLDLAKQGQCPCLEYNQPYLPVLCQNQINHAQAFLFFRLASNKRIRRQILKFCNCS